MKTKNAGKFRKLAKIFAGVAKFRNPCEKNFAEPLHSKFHQTSIDHNFFVQTPIHVFLDSMKSSLSLESNHILFNSIWCKNFLYDSGDKRDLINKIKGYNLLVWVASLDGSGGNLNV